MEVLESRKLLAAIPDFAVYQGVLSGTVSSQAFQESARLIVSPTITSPGENDGDNERDILFELGSIFDDLSPTGSILLGTNQQLFSDLGGLGNLEPADLASVVLDEPNDMITIRNLTESSSFRHNAFAIGDPSGIASQIFGISGGETTFIFDDEDLGVRGDLTLVGQVEEDISTATFDATFLGNRQTPDLAVEITSNRSVAEAGDAIIYTATITNNGNVFSRNETIRLVPTGDATYDFFLSSVEWSSRNGGFEFEIESLAPDQSESFSFGMQVETVLTPRLTLDASVRSDDNEAVYGIEPDTDDNFASITTPLRFPNTTPDISSIRNQVVTVNTTSDLIAFLIIDQETSVDLLELSAVAADSNLIPDDAFRFEGETSARTLTVTPASGLTGVTTVTVTVTDERGLSASTDFQVTVMPNMDPTITPIPDQFIAVDSSTPILGFQVADQETPIEQLVVTASSTNPELIPDRNIRIGGTVDNRTISLTPLPGQSGEATIVISARDNGNGVGTRAFRLVVGSLTVEPIVTISGTGPDRVPDPSDLPTGPQPTSWAQQRSDLREIVIDVAEPIVAVATADIVLTNLGMDPLNDPDETIFLRDSQLILSSDGTQLTLRLDANQLSDGVYQIDLLSRITGGQPYRFRGNTENRFFVLRGDFNGSGGVNIQDFATFGYWFGNDTSVAPHYVDTNASGGVNIQDFADYAQNFGKSVVLPVVAGVTSQGAEGENANSFEAMSMIAGDVNGDGVVSVQDALTVREELDEQDQHLRYDSNGDLRVSSADVLYVVNRMDPSSIVSATSSDEDEKDDESRELVDEVLTTIF